MKKLIAIACIFLFNLNIYSLVYAEGDAVKGKEYYKICAACHGQNGEANKRL